MLDKIMAGLKAKGLDVAEEIVVKIVEEVFDSVSEEVLAELKAKILAKIDLIDGEDDPGR